MIAPATVPVPLKPGTIRHQATPAEGTAINVGDAERLLSVYGGSALAWLGLKRGSIPGLLLAAAGGAIAYRGLTGHCHLYEALDVSTAEKPGPATSVRAGHGFKVEQTIA